MQNSIISLVLLSTLFEDLRQELDSHLEEQLEKIKARVLAFPFNPLSPAATCEFEKMLQEEVRELARQMFEWAVNHVEEDAEAMPHFIRFQSGCYRLHKEKSDRRHGVDTLFGKIWLSRFRYRYSHRQPGEPDIFPLELQLGLICGATPALAERVGRYTAEAGATQDRVRQRLREEHQLRWSVDRLRTVIRMLAEEMGALLHRLQVAKLLQLLAKAHASSGRHRPILAVGRDGVTLPIVDEGYKVGGVATVSVYDRKGNRLGTVYLAHPPEEGQETLSSRLTKLVRAVLASWTKPLPRLCYVTDGGSHEEDYYRNVLRFMRNPHCKGERLKWHRIVDYYHAAIRCYAMARAIQGNEKYAAAFGKSLCDMLLKPNGAKRVLNAAARMRSLYGLREGQAESFYEAYNYLRKRTKFLRYAECRRWGMPIGSGVTEAACKTIVTQRLKLSGMRWKRAGAEAVITLRTILLSGVWDDVFQAMLSEMEVEILETRATSDKSEAAKAA